MVWYGEGLWPTCICDWSESLQRRRGTGSGFVRANMGLGFGWWRRVWPWRMLHRGVCFERRRIKGSGETEIFYEESIYSHRRRVYIFNKKKKKSDLKIKKMMMWKIVVLAKSSVLYIYIDEPDWWNCLYYFITLSPNKFESKFKNIIKSYNIFTISLFWVVVNNNNNNNIIIIILAYGRLTPNL